MNLGWHKFLFMKKVKKIGIAVLLFAISIAAFASAEPSNKCNDNYVITSIGDPPHPFWGSSTVATYGYESPDGCVYLVSCRKKYRFWINFGTEAIMDPVPLFCD